MPEEIKGSAEVLVESGGSEKREVAVKYDPNVEAAYLILYVMHKAHLLTSNNLRQVFEILKEEKPEEGIVQYLLNQAAKA